MAESSATPKARVKNIKKVCRSCGKNRNLTISDCCNNWICDDSINYRKGYCYYEHKRYSCCTSHHNNGHKGNLEDCKECAELGLSEYEFEEVTCASCGFKSRGMLDFALQLGDDFYCTKDECQTKVRPASSRPAKKRIVLKKVKRACRSCGKTKKLTRTECCNNWICNDEHKYRLFSFALNSCYRNHHRYSSCTNHFYEKHEGRWQECEKCKENSSMVCSDFDDVTCVSCGFKSGTMENFAFQISGDFYCKEKECQKKGKELLPKGKAGVKKVTVKKIKRACCLCRKTQKLTKTECCDSWICNDSHKYRLFSFAHNSCWRNHHRYSCCSYHHVEKHEGNWRDCEECRETGDQGYDLEEMTCASCGLKSQTKGDFAFQVKKDYYCKKVECQKVGKTPPPPKVKKTPLSQKVKKTLSSQKGGKPPPSKGTKRKAERSGAEVMKAKKACRLCGKARKLTKTECCDSWTCNTSSALTSCYQNHNKYSCCAFHHSQGHGGKAQDCVLCKKLGTFNFDFDGFETKNSDAEKENFDAQNIQKVPLACVCCGFTSESADAFAFQLNGDFYCIKDECQKKGKPPLSEN